jgi:transposase
MVTGQDFFSMFEAALGMVAAVAGDLGGVRRERRRGFTDWVGLPAGSRFSCPVQGCVQSAFAVHDTWDKRWRHLDFFAHRAFLAARVSRVSRVEWGQHGIHLVEVAMLTFVRQMPIAPLARIAREHHTRVWRVVEHHVRGAREGLDFSDVTDVGMDETSARRGQDYVSIFMDLDQRRVMFATAGKDAETVKAFAADLAGHRPRCSWCVLM